MMMAWFARHEQYLLFRTGGINFFWVSTFTLSSKGAGTLEYPGNDEFLRQFYEGDFVNKKAHGKGMMRWNQGDKYEGDWQEGLRHGEGTYFSKVSNQYHS